MRTPIELMIAAIDADGRVVVRREDVQVAVSVLHKVIAHAYAMGGLDLMGPESEAVDRLGAALTEDTDGQS